MSPTEDIWAAIDKVNCRTCCRPGEAVLRCVIHDPRRRKGWRLKYLHGMKFYFAVKIWDEGNILKIFYHNEPSVETLEMVLNEARILVKYDHFLSFRNNANISMNHSNCPNELNESNSVNYNTPCLMKLQAHLIKIWAWGCRCRKNIHIVEIF